MKWIKASERVPEKIKNIVFRYIDTKDLMTRTIEGILDYSDSIDDHLLMLSRQNLSNIEWLDESEEDSSKYKVLANEIKDWSNCGNHVSEEIQSMIDDIFHIRSNT